MKPSPLEKVTMSTDSYLVRVTTQKHNGNGYKEQHFGSRKKLFVYDRLIASTSPNGSLDLGGLEKAQFNSFLGHFNKKLYSQFLKYPELMYKEVDFKGTAKHRNIKSWNKLPIGSFFYNIDMSSAYWQVLHKLGYIDESFYQKYMFDSDYKTAKRFCVSFLARTNKMIYTLNDGSQHTIECNIDVLNQVYQNVRKELYRIIKSSLKENTDYLEYNIDGVLVPISMAPEIKDFFASNGIRYKTTICQKISERQYRSGTRIKNFIRPKQR